MKIKDLLKKFSFPWYTKYGTWIDKYFDIWIENPLGTWWKARKYFKLPKISFHPFFNIHHNCPYISYKNVGKILGVDFHDISWKDKWNSPRHEMNPYIWICLFRRFGFSINFDIYYRNEFGELESGDTYYWEYLLEWLYYKEKKTLRCYSAWQYDSRLYRNRIKYGNAEDGSEDEYRPFEMVVPCVALSLNKKGIKKLKEEMKDVKV
jgi:hypothetical protein